LINTTADRGDDLNNQETRSLITASDTFSLIGRLYDVNTSGSHLGAKEEYLRYLQLAEVKSELICLFERETENFKSNR
jgi:hypothetical protein